MKLPIIVQAHAQVDAVEILVRLVDHFREDPSYSDEDRQHGIAAAETVIRTLTTKTGPRQIVGAGAMG